SVPPRLRRLGASFVTVRRDGELAGCIGSLEAVRPLWRDVERNARAAAGDDPRFPPLTADDLGDVAVKVSVLSRTEPLPADRDGLRAALRPGVDGVLVEAAGRRGTFLPSVWDVMPDLDGFLDALLAKAGLPGDPWPADLRAWRYTTDEFGA
ncbi:MAG TPA: AmmeMemoRadiSam system protein A, partial [Acidimicrobiales bacterium]|nr:AmmeMemoRadiSam system protein A [Acidimicrobiales bacterium]